MDLRKLLNERIQTHQDGSKERWRDVVGYSGYYRVSDWGRIKRHLKWIWQKGDHRRSGFWTHRKGGIIKIRTDVFPAIPLSKPNEKPKVRKLYQLVLEAFVGPRPKGCVCCHFPDKSVFNNRLENLRWDTPKANCRDRDMHGTTARGERAGAAKVTNEQAIEIYKLYQTGEFNYQEIGDRFDVAPWVVSGIVSGKTYTEINLPPLVTDISGQGNHPRNGGETHGMAKLKSQDILYIRRRFDREGSKCCKEIADQLGVHTETIREVGRRNRYRNVPEENQG